MTAAARATVVAAVHLWAFTCCVQAFFCGPSEIPRRTATPTETTTVAATTSYRRIFSTFDDHDDDDHDKTMMTNQDPSNGSTWETISQFVTVESPWLRLVGEKLLDNHGQLIDYWRVEKDASAVILTLHRGQLVLPKPQYRPGIQRCTLDFCGGRVPNDENKTPVLGVVPSILKRELGVALNDIKSIVSLNSNNNCHNGSENSGDGWPIDSSFSNQVLFGFVATIRDEVELDSTLLDEVSYRYPTTADDGTKDATGLLSLITCLQCRAVLLTWMLQERGERSTLI